MYNHLTKDERRHIATLTRRSDHLARRIVMSDKDLTFDRAERAALDWAISQLTNDIDTRHTPREG
jgi:hypothetical protein